ncbi:hypothetical protein Trydic_g8708 [Trypoxylus dichotomus]
MKLLKLTVNSSTRLHIYIEAVSLFSHIPPIIKATDTPTDFNLYGRARQSIRHRDRAPSIRRGCGRRPERWAREAVGLIRKVRYDFNFPAEVGVLSDETIRRPILAVCARVSPAPSSGFATGCSAIENDFTNWERFAYLAAWKVD